MKRVPQRMGMGMGMGMGMRGMGMGMRGMGMRGMGMGMAMPRGPYGYGGYGVRVRSPAVARQIALPSPSRFTDACCGLRLWGLCATDASCGICLPTGTTWFEGCSPHTYWLLTAFLYQQQMAMAYANRGGGAAAPAPAAGAGGAAGAGAATAAAGAQYYAPYAAFGGAARPPAQAQAGLRVSMGHLTSGTHPQAAQATAAGLQAGPAGIGSNINSKGPDDANLFVYNVPPEGGDFELYQMFAPYGTILSAKVFIDKMTGLSKGFGKLHAVILLCLSSLFLFFLSPYLTLASFCSPPGFVSFADNTHAQGAIAALHGRKLAGRVLKVEVKKNRSRPY